MKYCKCKIQNAPIYKKIKDIFYFVCSSCGKIRQMKSWIEIYLDGYDGLESGNGKDWDLSLGDFTIDMIIERNNDGTIKGIANG